MNIRERIEYLFNEIDSISYPSSKILTISEVEEELSKCEDSEMVSISYEKNITEAYESENLSDYARFVSTILGIIKDGKCKAFTDIVEDLAIPRKTKVTFTPKESNDRVERIIELYRELNTLSPILIQFNMRPRQENIKIEINDPLIMILGDFKKMCRRREQIMMEVIQHETLELRIKEAIEDALVGIHRRWDTQGGYKQAIAEIKGTKKRKITCKLLDETLKNLRNPAEHQRHNMTVNDVRNLISKIQELTPNDILPR